MNFIHKGSLTPSKWLSRWIKVDKWNYFYFHSQGFLFSILVAIYFLQYETSFRRSVSSFGHSHHQIQAVSDEFILIADFLREWEKIFYTHFGPRSLPPKASPKNFVHCWCSKLHSHVLLHMLRYVIYYLLKVN